AACAAHLAGPGLRVARAFTGRANVHAEVAGVLRVERRAVDGFNAVDEGLTLATLADHARVEAGAMVATVKVIPYAVPSRAVERASAALGPGALRLHPFRARTVDLILTEVPGMKPSLLDKGAHTVRARVERLGLHMGAEVRVAHEIGALREALSAARGEMLLILGASATSDRADVGPEALRQAGGVVDRFGMPVDPGNLLFLGRLGERDVIGLPGCVRSPALNGADWVLERLAADLTVSGEDIAGMGVGGLLKEIPQRPQPRARRPKGARVEIALLAAGASRRMGGRDKLMEDAGGVPLLRRSAAAAADSAAACVRVALPVGSARAEALDGLDVDVVEVADPGEGMAASLRAALEARAPDTAAVIVALADMPDIAAKDYDALIAGFDPEAGAEIVRATDADGRPGHPILFGARFFDSLSRVTGDRGARDVLHAAQDFTKTVALSGRAATTDLDTPEAWKAWRRSGS
ncbi:molybdopterin-binding/glycosyltransferase family 2 protein, partial [Roseobacter sp. HKCCA0434]|uniref:molybdopterin-binding/glycosyltransferase family 2 protein n=1 Tax=Roseobacter sp. HKCCA0434 TaxID=3079297 RepID=UPI00290594A7